MSADEWRPEIELPIAYYSSTPDAVDDRGIVRAPREDTPQHDAWSKLETVFGLPFLRTVRVADLPGLLENPNVCERLGRVRYCR
jgi:hypothetical protein